MTSLQQTQILGVYQCKELFDRVELFAEMPQRIRLGLNAVALPGRFMMEEPVAEFADGHHLLTSLLQDQTRPRCRPRSTKCHRQMFRLRAPESALRVALTKHSFP
ncbi:hypothetical protein CEY04_04165 [Achromobacter sp. HZ28]|nr:hypothetical protein CEY05_04170 [Achromobacter sp. HZ34]OWT82469.1 hypothetical protein CEY04_04165 [Achromobacter sp. HZ28]